MEISILWASRPLIAPYSPEMLAVVRGSLPRNRALGITGALYFTDQAFIQVLEGPSGALDGVMQRIVGDQRHTDVTVIDTQPLPVRLFSGHDMKFVDGARYRVAERPIDFDTVVHFDGCRCHDLTLAMLRA